MTQLPRRVRWLIPLLVCALWSGFSRAVAAPAVLDLIPPTTPIVVAVSTLKDLDAGTSELLGAMEARSLGSLSQALVAMGLRDGLDLQGSAAGLLFDPEGKPAAEESPRMVLVLPVSDAGRFLGSLQAKDDEGLSRFEYAGVPYFAKRVDETHLAMSSERALVASLALKPGNMAQHQAAAGARGREVLDRCPIVALGKPSLMRPMLERVLSPLAAGVPGLPGFGAAAPGDRPAESGAPGLLHDPRTSIAGRLARVALDEASFAVVGLQPGPLGLRIDAAAAFPDDALMAKACQGESEDPEPFRMLPNQPYLFAGATNTAHPGIRLLLDELGPGPQAVGPLAEAERAIFAAASEMNTASVVIYSPPNLMFGVLTRTIAAWDARAPRDGGVWFQKWLEQLKAQDTGANATKTTYTAAARTIADAKIDEWTITPPAGSSPLLPIFFGPVDGPQGFFAATEHFGYLTWARDEALLASTLETASKGAGSSLHADLMLQQVSELLPRPRAIEWYIDIRPVLKQARTMLGDRAPLPADMPDELPPIGAAVVMTDGSIQVSAFVPAPLLRIAFYAFSQAGEMGDDPDADDARNAPGNGREGRSRRERPARSGATKGAGE